ncbi:MAG: ParB N-terminal domain-containing protein, partial [Candidatus Hydrogenedentales bacterium]
MPAHTHTPVHPNKRHKPKRGPQLFYLHQLVENPQNERKTFENMDGLIETVRALGVIEPLTAAPHGPNQYQIVTGHRRFR